MRVEWIEEPAALQALTGPWRALAGDAPPFLGPDWFAAWWAAFGRQGATACTVRDGDTLAAVLPLIRRRGTLTATANDETPAFGPIARDREALERLAAAVVTAAPKLRLQALPDDDDGTRALRGAASAAGRLVVTDFGFNSPLVDTRGSFDAYRARMKRGWVETERRTRKLRREHEVELRLLEAPGVLEGELEEGLALEAAGWKGRSGSAILSSPQTAAFYRRVARDAHGRGELALSSLRVDGRLAAWDLAICTGGRYFLLKTAFDEPLRRLSPGLVLRRAVVEACFGAGLTAHEFLGQDAAWKGAFATGRRTHLILQVYEPRGRAALDYAYRRRLRPIVRAAAVRAGLVPERPRLPVRGDAGARSNVRGPPG